MTTQPTDHVVFYTREGIEIASKTFNHHTDAAEWFYTLENPGSSDLPPHWYAARLFDALGIIDTIYNA